jgi:hypothetical protein
LGDLTSVPNLTDKEILQTGLNGAFTENKLPNPTTIVACFDDDTAHRLIVFGGDILAKGAKGSISDLISIVTTMKAFFDSLPQPVKQCLDGNK